MDYYTDTYGNLNDLSLPRTPRTYFDALCHEFGCYPVEQKLLDIGYLTTMGYDIRKDIYHSFQNYDHVTEDNVHRGVQTLEAAACGLDYFSSGFNMRNNKLDIDIDLMLEEIMARYRYPIPQSMGHNISHYIATNKSKMTKHELDSLNGWKSPYFSDNIGFSALYFKDGIMTYPGDETIILKHNKKRNSLRNKILTEMIPEPWYGDVLSAKVIILGYMPSYDDFICRSQNLLLDIRIREQVILVLKSWHELNNTEIYAYPRLYGQHKLEIPSVGPVDTIETMDMYFSPTYRHWVNSLRKFSEENHINEDHTFKNVAIINAFPYYCRTNQAKPLSLGLLPSHYFLRQLVRYIHSNNPNVIFVIPSANIRETWRTILSDMYYSIYPRISSKSNTNLSLNSYAIGQDIIDAIVERLNS